MSEDVQLVSVEAFVAAATARIAQLDQAEAVLGPDTVSGLFMAEARGVWERARSVATADGIEATGACIAMIGAHARAVDNFGRETGVQEVLLAVAGVNTFSDAIVWLRRHLSGGHRHG